MKRTYKLTLDSSLEDYREQDSDVTICTRSIRKMFKCTNEELEDTLWVTLSDREIKNSVPAVFDQWTEHVTVMGHEDDLGFYAIRELMNFFDDAGIGDEPDLMHFYIRFEVMS